MIKRNFQTTKYRYVFDQAMYLFNELEPYLNDIIRTWIYIKDIDDTYKAVSNARNIFFERVGLEDGPYFASTGIGKPDNQFYPGELIHLSALIVPNLDRNELTYLENTDVMPHTRDYSVKFERGVVYKDRYIVSGTASIDKHGNVQHRGDLIKQMYQALYNINALLKKHDRTFYNAKEITGYVRNIDDIETVKKECKKIYPSCKWNIIEGKVCRPDWLVEFELMI